MRIAIASTDDETLCAHFRHSDRFVVYDIQGGQIRDREVRTLDSSRNRSDDSGTHDHGEAIDLLADCCAVICGGMGSRVAADFSRYGIEPVVARDCERSPLETAALFAEGRLPRGSVHACCCGSHT